jgi:tetratricopeptide (TPR) repeat protein
MFKYIVKFNESYRYSPLGIFIVSNIYSHAGKNERALENIEKYNSGHTEIKIDYLDYFHGLLLLQKGRPEAKKYFEKFIREFNGMHFIRSAYHKLAWCWLLEGNDEQYNLYISLSRNAGKEVIDSDKQSLSESKSGKIPHKDLLKARLLSDGGYFDSALAVMREIDTVQICKIHTYCLEYYYRMARISHLNGDTFSAMELYNKVILLGSNDKEYFAANSALMMGLLYEDMKDYTNASKYFKKSLSLPFDEYRNSIQQKAKAGLQRVGQ